MNLTGDSKENRVALIVGPTASGKTEIALRTAGALRAENVTADSRQVYRYMDIGTAKPAPQERQRVPHHFIDIRDPDQYYSAGDYAREARETITGLLARGVTPLVVGGSGFYLSALVDGLSAPRFSDPAVKARWRRRAARDGVQALHSELARIDPEAAARLHPNDVQRVVRALEVFELSGRPLSDFKAGEQTPAGFTPVFFGLRRERADLVGRIDRRADLMLEAGLLDEVRRLAQRGWGPELNALRSVGYREVFQYLEGGIGYGEMVEAIRLNTRRYAKRQMTWFRREPRIRWIDLGERSALQAASELLALWRESD